MSQGWIKFHRSILEWEWYLEPNTLRLFIHLLLKANRAPGKYMGIDLEPGQLITGRKQLSNELRMSEREIRTSLNRLKSTSSLTIKTTNKFSLITICKYADYQSTENNKRPTERPTERPTNDQQTTTNKNIRINKNEIYGIFEDFRKRYPGTKRGVQIELDNFLKKNPPEAVHLLLIGLEREIQDKDRRTKAGDFCPSWKNLSTWINQKCWDQEFSEIPTNGHEFEIPEIIIAD